MELNEFLDLETNTVLSIAASAFKLMFSAWRELMNSLCNLHALYTSRNQSIACLPSGGTVDIDESELDVDEGVELVDSAGLPIREKMVYMSVGDAHQTQDDISEFRTHSATEI